MSRTRQVLEQLREINPVVAAADGSAPPAAPARSHRARLAFAGAAIAVTAIALLAVVALNPGDDSDGVIAAAAATAADQPPIAIAPDQFAYRTEQWFQPSIPGVVATATPQRLDIVGADKVLPPRTGTREVWFSPRNRGLVKGDKGPWPPCTAADYVIDYAIKEICWSDVGGPAGLHYLFEDPLYMQRIIRRHLNPKPQPYWEFSPDIAKLGTDPAKINAAVSDLGKVMEDGRGTFDTLGDEGTAISIKPTNFNDSAFKLRAVADLLANPLAPPEVRAALFRYAGGIEGVQTAEEATDPEGRTGASISITSTPADPAPIIMSGLPSRIEEPLNQYTKNGYPIDLSGLTFRTQIIFDPNTSELLSESTQLVAADDPLLGPWLKREGAPQTVFSRTFDPVAEVGSAGERPNG